MNEFFFNSFPTGSITIIWIKLYGIIWREKEREKRERVCVYEEERIKQTDREKVCVFVCVCGCVRRRRWF